MHIHINIYIYPRISFIVKLNSLIVNVSVIYKSNFLLNKLYELHILVLCEIIFVFAYVKSYAP